MNTDRYINP